MIRVIIERQLKKGARIWLSDMIRELRAAAMQYPGYMTGETLVDTEDKSKVAVISTWHSIEDWKEWAQSETRSMLYKQTEPFVEEKPRIRIFRIVATEGK